MEEKKMNSQQIEGRNAVMEAFRSGKPIDKVYILDGCQDGPIRSIVREAKKHDTILNFVTKERLNQISETGRHQGVIAQTNQSPFSFSSSMVFTRLVTFATGV